MTDVAKTKVLIADDLRTSRLIIKNLLDHWGYEAVACEDGLAAKEAIAAPDGPRVAILDWVMPGMTGPEICKWILEEFNSFVYTILLTSRNEQQDLIDGLSAGANAYITKPARPAELETWIRVGHRMVNYEMELARRNEELQAYAIQMETLAEERARQLVHADRMVTLGTMSAGIAHEINNSTTMLSGNVQTLERFWPAIQDSLSHLAPDSPVDERLPFILEETPALLAGMRTGIVRITKIVQSLRTFARRDDSVEFVECQVNDRILSTLQLCENALKRTAEVQLNLDPTLPGIMASPHGLEQVFANLVVNACDAMRPTAPGVLSISSRRDREWVVLTFEDTGTGISDEVMARMWDPFYTTKEPGKGTGLGLSVSLGIIKAHGGSYTVENRKSGGARFVITLPVNPPTLVGSPA